jgi:hypothetical protein
MPVTDGPQALKRASNPIPQTVKKMKCFIFLCIC